MSYRTSVNDTQIFGNNDYYEGLSTTYVYTKTRVLKGGSQDYLREQIAFNKNWWNAPYTKGVE